MLWFFSTGAPADLGRCEDNPHPPTERAHVSRCFLCFYLHDHLVLVKLDTNGDGVRQQAELVHRAVVDAYFQRLPVHLEERSRRIAHERLQYVQQQQQLL